jgi:hypothetical protein
VRCANPLIEPTGTATPRSSPVLPAAAPADDAAEGSRGLWLVDALSARWGYERGGGLATTWFELGQG